VQTADGLTIAHEVFEDNVAETKTLAPMITRLLECFQLQRVVIVADRGLLSLDNVDTLRRWSVNKGWPLTTSSLSRRGAMGSSPRSWSNSILASLRRPRPLMGNPSPGPPGRADGWLWLITRSAPPSKARIGDGASSALMSSGSPARCLENQNAGKAALGRRSTDRSAYQRCHKAVIE